MTARRRSGFTLLELLLVLGILVILASLVAVNISGVMQQSDADAARAQIGLIERGIDLYHVNVKQYPSNSAGLAALLQVPSDVPDPSKWKGPYLDKELPLDPWGRPYQYLYPGRRNVAKVDIWSLGPDGIDGTDDDIGNWKK